MDIKDVVDFLNFWINKKTNSYLTIPECIAAIDRGQMALYSDYKAKYATSQLIKDALSPFKDFYDFTSNDTLSGYISVPSDSNYLDCLDIMLSYVLSSRTIYIPVALVNEDTRAYKLNSQIDPVTTTSPIAEQIAPRFLRIYPTSGGYTGTVTYFRRPVAPVYAYTLISGRVPVYDEANSVQLEWAETYIVPLLLKALESVGVNLNSGELTQFAEMKTQSNFQGINKL